MGKMAVFTEFVLNLCAGMGPLELGVVLVFHFFQTNVNLTDLPIKMKKGKLSTW